MSGWYVVVDDDDFGHEVKLDQLMPGEGRPCEVELTVAGSTATFADPEKLRLLASKLMHFAAWLDGTERGEPRPRGGAR
jgi:hypothetical protein